MNTKTDIYEELLNLAKREEDRAREEACVVFDKLLSLSILSSLSPEGGKSILLEEEKHDWEDRNKLIEDYKQSMMNVVFWRQRYALLVEYGTKPFSNLYDSGSEQEKFVMSLRKNDG
jgi:hypothetical protein